MAMLTKPNLNQSALLLTPDPSILPGSKIAAETLLLPKQLPQMNIYPARLHGKPYRINTRISPTGGIQIISIGWPKKTIPVLPV